MAASAWPPRAPGRSHPNWPVTSALPRPPRADRSRPSGSATVLHPDRARLAPPVAGAAPTNAGLAAWHFVLALVLAPSRCADQCRPGALRWRGSNATAGAGLAWLGLRKGRGPMVHERGL